MPITIGLNIASLQLGRNLNRVQAGVAESMQRLSSGMRITSAADDAAGLSVAASLRSSSAIYGQALRNISDGVSLFSVADAALSELANITTRISELAQQAATGTYTTAQRSALDTEADALVSEYRRLVSSTTFNGIEVFDPGRQTTAIQVGAGNNSTLVLPNATAPDIGTTQTSTSATAYGTFGPGVNYPAGNGLYAIDLKDFDNDGDLDVITSSDNILLYLNDGSGTFSYTFDQPFAGSIGVTAGDFNEDGKMDFVAGATGDIMFYAGDGVGGFAAPTTLGFPVYNTALRSGDFNNDGHLDVAFTTGPFEDLFLFNGRGDGTFGSVQTITMGNVSGTPFEVTDVNGDTIDDVVIKDGDDVKIFLGNGAGLSSVPDTTINSGAGGVFGTSVGDVNGDGRQDIVASHFGVILTYLQNLNGTFSSSITTAQEVVGQSPLMVDVNNDGKDDFVSIAGTTAYVRYSNGDGTFAASITSPGFVFNFSVAGDQNVVDLDGDGLLDFVSVHGGGSFQVHLGEGEITTTTTGAEIDLTSQESARAALTQLASVAESLAQARGVVGAQLNRLETSARVTATMKQQFDEARSRIEDVDVADEVAKLVSLQIRQKAITSFLAQANQATEVILRLLDPD